MTTLNRSLFLGFCLLWVVSCQKQDAPKTEVAQAVAHNPNELNAVLSDSLLTITAVKDGNIPVKGSLSVSAGVVKKTEAMDWQLDLTLDPKSWNSGLALRDERVRDIFLQVAKSGFESIRFSMNGISDAVVQNVKMGTDQTLPVTGALEFAGLKKELSFEATLKLVNGKISVAPASPIVISIADWGLDAAKQNLMQVCNHREIQNEVSVTFDVQFE